MALTLNEEQRLLRETAREFLGANAPVGALRALRDARDPLGYSRELWTRTVSYTHLDVYKRQRLTSTMRRKSASAISWK